MTEHKFTLQDRIAKIKSINELYDLEHNAYASFSGGKDSTVLHYLIDEALPGNRIPRVFINTGIEYKAILQFVKGMAAKDDRFIIWTVGKNIKETLERVGYPFKSKEHSQKLFEWKQGCRSKSHLKYFREVPDGFALCPKVLMYQKEPDFNLKVSHLCCVEFKKKPAKEYMKQSGRHITLTGMMKSEGGQRTTLNCIVTDKDGKLKKFHPMAICSNEWEDWYIAQRSIKLCLDVYRKWAAYTACAFKVIRRIIEWAQLDTLERLLPTEKKRAELIWKPVYAEYRRIGYRLRKEDNQPSLFGGEM
jgi:3'-phosphoadenosine 5'-phosphosulfate sulfotransferase (PAPS reductase)/FAD synthetase